MSKQSSINLVLFAVALGLVITVSVLFYVADLQSGQIEALENREIEFKIVTATPVPVDTMEAVVPTETLDPTETPMPTATPVSLDIFECNTGHTLAGNTSLRYLPSNSSLPVAILDANVQLGLLGYHYANPIDSTLAGGDTWYQVIFVTEDGSFSELGWIPDPLLIIDDSSCNIGVPFIDILHLDISNGNGCSATTVVPDAVFVDEPNGDPVGAINNNQLVKVINKKSADDILSYQIITSYQGILYDDVWIVSDLLELDPDCVDLIPETVQ